VPLFMGFVAGFSLLVAAAIALLPSSIVEPAVGKTQKGDSSDWKHQALPVLAVLFFIYVGTENSFGGWIASYANSLGTMSRTVSVMTPSFFYIALMLGRWLAPLLLRKIDEVRFAQYGLLLACAGMAALLASRSMFAVMGSAAIAGFGLATIYPITISLLAREFGPAASRVGSVMFTAANLGGAVLPWLVGAASNQLGSLKIGLAVPLIGGVCMLVLYRREWKMVTPENAI
jgi:fucose permease